MIWLEVVGIPAPQGSKRGFVVNGRAVVVEGGSKAGREKVGSWRQDVIDACARWRTEQPDGTHLTPIDGPVAMTVTFRLPKPPSAPKKRRHPAVRPDWDKLARATCDALKLGLIYRDDAQVVECHVVKRYAAADESPGAAISLWTPA